MNLYTSLNGLDTKTPSFLSQFMFVLIFVLGNLINMLKGNFKSSSNSLKIGSKWFSGSILHKQPQLVNERSIFVSWNMSVRCYFLENLSCRIPKLRWNEIVPGNIISSRHDYKLLNVSLYWLEETRQMQRTLPLLCLLWPFPSRTASLLIFIQSTTAAVRAGLWFECNKFHTKPVKWFFSCFIKNSCSIWNLWLFYDNLNSQHRNDKK